MAKHDEGEEDLINEILHGKKKTKKPEGGDSKTKSLTKKVDLDKQEKDILYGKHTKVGKIVNLSKKDKDELDGISGAFTNKRDKESKEEVKTKKLSKEQEEEVDLVVETFVAKKQKKTGEVKTKNLSKEDKDELDSVAEIFGGKSGKKKSEPSEGKKFNRDDYFGI
jgi:hypothetical protein